MKILMSIFIFLNCGIALAVEDLYKDSTWNNLASDIKAQSVGDIVTVVVYQSAEARNVARNASDKSTSLGGSISTDTDVEFADIRLDNSYSGRGEIRRSESLLTQFSASVQEILPNGDLRITGEQVLYVNGERTVIGVQGRIRPVDITTDNRVLSTHIANAKISYNGSGFVSRSARPGILNTLFGVFRLGS